MKTKFLSLFNKCLSLVLAVTLTFTPPALWPLAAAESPPPPLMIQRLGSNQVMLSWTSAIPSLRLEQADNFSDCTPWRSVVETPVIQGQSHSLTLPVTEASHFFQLYLPPELNLPPRLCPIGDQTIAVGETIDFDVDAIDPNRDPLTFLVAPLPLIQNASYQSQGNRFTFTPSTDQYGKHTFTFLVSDGTLVDSKTITVTVTGPPLQIRVLAGNRLQVSWPASASSFVPEQNSSSTAQGWQPVGIAPIAQGDRFAVNFNATAEARFFRLRAGDVSVNHPPTLAAVPNQTVALGDALTLFLSGSDPDNDPLTYAVMPLPLPVGAAFDSQSGVLTFRPGPDQTNNNSYALTFTVSDGTTNAARSATITVTNPSPGITSLRGKVITSGRAPLPNVRIEVGTNAVNPQALTDANGNFLITNTPFGRQRVLIDGSTVGNGRTYATVPEMTDLIPGALNVLDPPSSCCRSTWPAPITSVRTPCPLLIAAPS